MFVWRFATLNCFLNRDRLHFPFSQNGQQVSRLQVLLPPAFRQLGLSKPEARPKQSLCVLATTSHSPFVHIKPRRSRCVKVTLAAPRNKGPQSEAPQRKHTRRRSGDEVRSPRQLFSSNNLTFIWGVYPSRRDKCSNPQNKKGDREQNPCHECHLRRCPVFLSSFSFVALLSGPALSLSLPHSPSLSLSQWNMGLKRTRGERRTERATARRRVYCVCSDADLVNPYRKRSGQGRKRGVNNH